MSYESKSNSKLLKNNRGNNITSNLLGNQNVLVRKAYFEVYCLAITLCTNSLTRLIQKTVIY